MRVYNRKSGFTLIELLVVIAIIAILAAILFPVFIGAKVKALQTKCMSNLKQIGTATSMYMSDTGGMYPPHRANLNDSANLAGAGTWFHVVEKYSKTQIIANCPADGSKTGGNYALSAGVGVTSQKKPNSYWQNIYLHRRSGLGGSNPNMTSLVESAVTYTRTTVYIMDGPITGWGSQTWWGPPTWWEDGAITYTNPPWQQLAKAAESRHGGGANVLFCDWHIKLVRPNEWKSDRVNTYSSNPILSWPPNLSKIPNDWRGNRNDGQHPWFRPD